jgi:hypothetical protein
MRWIALGGLLIALAGCGWSTSAAPVDQDQAVRDAIENYRDAWLKVDPVRVCAAFSVAARTALEDSIGHPCTDRGATYIFAPAPEQIHVHLWRISSVVVRGDRATVRFAPIPHLKDRRQALVREPDGWKLERSYKSFDEGAPWEHCVSKLVYELGDDAAARGLVGNTVYDYSERWCTDMMRLPTYPTDADYDRLRNTILKRLVGEGKLTPDEAERFKHGGG